MENNLNLFDMLMQLLDRIIAATPKVLAALIIVIIGYIVSKQLAKVLKRFLKRTKVDSFAERLNNIDLVERSKLKLVPSQFLSKVLYYILLLVFLIVAADVLDMPAVSALVMDVINFIPRLLTAFLILLLGVFVSDAVRKIVLTTCQSLNIPAAKIIAGFMFYFLFLNILMTALKQAGIQVESLSQNISILLGGLVLAFGIGYGFASKDIFANILSSYYYKSNLKIGNRVTIAQHTGIVEDITRNHVIIQSDNDKLVHVPIHKLSSEDIIIHNS